MESKKAQIEIVGLLVIVILVTTIILLVIIFGVRNPDKPKTTQQVEDLQITTLLFPTMLETTTGCGRSLRELIGDCAYANEITCESDTLNSCEYANATIQEILSKTIDVYGYDYLIRIYTPNSGNELFRLEKGGCGPARSSIQKQSPFPTQFDYQTVIWSIRICQEKK